MTVTDDSAPILTVPANITVSTNGQATVPVTFTVTASDDADGPITPVQTAGLPSGGNFPVGVTTNTFTATDSGGNTASASFTVTVQDNTGPAVTITGAPVTASANQAFTVLVTFDEAVTGFDLADVQVVNGSATGLVAGSAANSFAVTIVATGGGDTTLSVPQNAAFDVANNGNEASPVVTVKSSVVAQTQAAIVDALIERSQLIANNQPNILLQTFDPFSGSGGQLGYLSIEGTPDDMTFAFSTSLGQLDRAIALGLQGRPAREAQETPDALASLEERILGPDRRGERKAMTADALQARDEGVDAALDTAGAPRSYDLWVNLNGARSSSGSIDSAYWIANVGGHWFVNRDLAIGALVQFDSFEQDNGATGGQFSGRGWMAGPYLAAQLPGSDLSFSARASWGRSDNDISPFGSYTDEFSTDRFLASAVLSGRYLVGGWTVAPKLEVNWFEETQERYVDRLGNTISEQTVSLGELSFGPSVRRTFATGDGGSFTPRVGVTGVWTFAKETGAITTSSPQEGDVRARLDALMGFSAPTGWELLLGGYYDGVFLDDYQSVGGTVTLRKGF